MLTFNLAATNGEGSSSEKAASDRDRGQRGRPRILVVEDEFLIADMIEAVIEDAGFETVGIAASMEEALELAARERPDFVTLDLRLRNGTSGLEVGKQLRRDYGLRALVVSGYLGEVPLDEEGLDSLGQVPKPFTEEELIEALKAAVRALRAH